MNFDEVEHLRTRHAAWRLLTSSNVALVLSFLGRVFVDANDSNIPAQRLIDELDDELYALNDRLRGEDDEEPRFPRPAKQYLEDWASTDKGWLRRFYPPGSDEPHYDLTPAVEKALAWVDDLRARSFIGTESRLSTIFELLRQMVHGADENPAARLADLERRRAVIDAEIAQLKAGDVVLADEVTQRDRYQQFARTARELLSDFRQVEANFRDLDRDLREQIALWKARRANCSMTCSRTGEGSPTRIRAEASGPSTTCCCRRRNRRSSPTSSPDFTRSTQSRTSTHAWPECTTTGSTPANEPRARFGGCRSSFDGSSTTRCGWRTVECSTCSTRSR